jgi:hypothetical protein
MGNSHDELLAAQRGREEINRKIAVLQAERQKVDQYIASLEKSPVNHPELPCWQCDRPEGRDVRHWLGCNVDPKAAMSLSGLPRGCCRIETFGRVSNPL